MTRSAATILLTVLGMAAAARHKTITDLMTAEQPEGTVSNAQMMTKINDLSAKLQNDKDSVLAEINAVIAANEDRRILLTAVYDTGVENDNARHEALVTEFAATQGSLSTQIDDMQILSVNQREDLTTLFQSIRDNSLSRQEAALAIQQILEPLTMEAAEDLTLEEATDAFDDAYAAHLAELNTPPPVPSAVTASDVEDYYPAYGTPYTHMVVSEIRGTLTVGPVTNQYGTVGSTHEGTLNSRIAKMGQRPALMRISVDLRNKLMTGSLVAADKIILAKQVDYFMTTNNIDPIDYAVTHDGFEVTYDFGTADQMMLTQLENGDVDMVPVTDDTQYYVSLYSNAPLVPINQGTHVASLAVQV